LTDASPARTSPKKEHYNTITVENKTKGDETETLSYITVEPKLQKRKNKM